MSTDVTIGAPLFDVTTSSALTAINVAMSATRGILVSIRSSDGATTARILTLNESTVTAAGSTTDFRTFPATAVEIWGIVRLTDTKAVVFYAYTTNYRPQAKVIDITGDVISLGTETALESSGTSGTFSVARLSDSSCLAVWERATIVRARVLTGITGSTITTNTLQDVTASGLTHPSLVAMLSDTAFVLSYMNGVDINVTQATISGTTVAAVGTPAVLALAADISGDYVVGATQVDGTVVAVHCAAGLTLATNLLTPSGSNLVVSTYTFHTPLAISAAGRTFAAAAMLHSDYMLISFYGTVPATGMQVGVIFNDGVSRGTFASEAKATAGLYSWMSQIDERKALLTWNGAGNDFKAAIASIDPPSEEVVIVPTPLPALQASLYGNYLLNATLPAFDAYMSGGPKPSAIKATLPAMTALLRTGAQINKPLPMMTVEMTGTTSLFLDLSIELPMMTASLSGTIDGTATVNATLPAMEAEMRGGGKVAAALPMISVELVGTTGKAAQITVALPMITAEMTGTALAYAIIEAVLPMIVPSPFGQIVAMMPMMQASMSGGIVVAVTYEAYAVNLKPGNKAKVHEVTRWDTMPFSGIVRHGNSYYGWGAGGLHLIGGTTDASAAIAWSWKTGITDFGTSQKKPMREMVFGGRIGPTAVASVSIGERADTTYSYSTPRGQLAQNYRVKTGKGLKDVFYSAGLSGTDVGDVDSVTFGTAESTRRI